VREPQSTASLRGALRSSAEPTDEGKVITIDGDRRITRITPDAAAWCGSTPEELIGVVTRERWPAPPLDDAVERALVKGETSTVEQASLVVPGRWVEVDVEPVDGGARVRIREVRARVGGERSAGAPTERGLSSLNDGPAEIVLLDNQGVIVSANAAWRASLAAHGVKVADDGIGMRYVDLCKAALPELDEASLERELQNLLARTVPQMEGTYNLEMADGQELRHVQITPLDVGDGAYFIAIHEDLTARARVLAALNETSDQLLHAQEQERRRIAIELHDSMSQHLAAMTLTLVSLRKHVGEDPTGRALIDNMSKLTKQAVRETRVLSYLMNAERQAREGLETALQRFVEGFGLRTGLETTIDIEGQGDAVNAAVHHAVFRVTQEALSNVHRHARATRVAVSLVRADDNLTLRIADDGRGLPRAPGENASSAPLGVGVPGMRSRIEQLGGRLDITSSAGGVVVTATLPLRGRR
jgi:signal transduction histidine kinase